MKIPKFNWPLWSGFLLSLIAFLSYPFVFVWFEPTRDFPWANFVLFALAAVLLFFGIKRAFSPDRSRPRRSRFAGLAMTALSVAVFGFFILTVFVVGKQLPASHGAPQVGQKALDFTLTDTQGKSVSLTELLASPSNGAPRKGVLLIFYRGYW